MIGWSCGWFRIDKEEIQNFDRESIWMKENLMRG